MSFIIKFPSARIQLWLSRRKFLSFMLIFSYVKNEKYAPKRASVTSNLAKGDLSGQKWPCEALAKFMPIRGPFRLVQYLNPVTVAVVACSAALGMGIRGPVQGLCPKASNNLTVAVSQSHLIALLIVVFVTKACSCTKYMHQVS